MTVKLDSLKPRNARILGLKDRLATPFIGQTAMPEEAFCRLPALQFRSEGRALPVAAAFFLFLFGVGCGATWTFILIWLF